MIPMNQPKKNQPKKEESVKTMNEFQEETEEKYMERAKTLIVLAIEALESAENKFARHGNLSRASDAADAKAQLILARKAIK